MEHITAELLGAIATRVKNFLEAREAADRKYIDLITRFHSLYRTLLALKAHVDTAHKEALELTENVVARAMADIVKWEKKSSMFKYRDGAKYDKLFQDHDRRLGERVAELNLAVSVANRSKLSSIAGKIDNQFRQFEFDPADAPEERASRLGKGMFGRTHRVVDRVLKERYAMKIINIADARDSGIDVESIRREARVMHRLSHQNIVSYNCCFEYKNGAEFCIIMEYVGGGHLGKQIGKSHEALTVQSWMRQLCDALVYMHALRVLHRDIKPENILVTDTLKSLKLADLGLSSIVSTTVAARSRVGTVLYMGPQRALGEKYGAAEDMWAVGCILAELLSRTSLVKRCPAGEIFSLDTPLISRVVKECETINASLGGVVHGLLEVVVARRFSAAEAVVRLGGERPDPGLTQRLPGLSEEDGEDDDATVETDQARQDMEAKHEQVMAEESRMAEEAQRQADEDRRQQLELQLQRERESEARARQTVDEMRRAREADEALALQFAEAKARRREAEAAAVAEAKAAAKARRIVDEQQRQAEKAQAVANKEAGAIISKHGMSVFSGETETNSCRRLARAAAHVDL